VAVVSVGDNTYGHPAPEVLDVLRAGGAFVLLTKEEGDVVVTLGD
jgi:competence protein ComEC